MITRYFYDCEFIEDGHTIDLVSIGIVADDGREYYAVSSEFDAAKLLRNPWLAVNVWPYLPTKSGYHFAPFERLDRGDPVVRPRMQIGREVQAFLLAGRGRPELWAWYGAYDHVVLCQLWGRMIDLPDGIPMWTNDIRQEQRRLGDPPMPEQSTKEHHALADARHNRVMFECLAELTCPEMQR
jgi:hypothetical protein